jgi:hypothetical protein
MRDNICEGREDSYEFLMTWIADIFQNSADKPGVAVTLSGEKGTGKSKLFHWLLRATGRYGLKVTHQRQIVGNFNAHQEGKLLAVVEEASCVTDKALQGVLKDAITSQEIMIEGKGRDPRSANNFMRYAFISNDEQIVAATKDERRYFCLRCGTGRQRDNAFFAALDREMENGGLQGFMKHIIGFQPKAGWQSAYSPPKTPYLRLQQAHALSPLEKFIVSLVRDGGYETESGSLSIELREHQTTECALVTLRAAAEDFFRTERARSNASFDGICDIAGRMLGARTIKRPKPRGTNSLRILVMPSLQDARRILHQEYGLEFDGVAVLGPREDDNIIPITRKAG